MSIEVRIWTVKRLVMISILILRKSSFFFFAGIEKQWKGARAARPEDRLQTGAESERY